MTSREFYEIVDGIIDKNKYRWHQFACGLIQKFCASIGIEDVKNLIAKMGTDGAQNYVRINWEEIRLNSKLDNKWASILPLKYSANEFLTLDDENIYESIYGIIEFMEMSGMNHNEITNMISSVSTAKRN